MYLSRWRIMIRMAGESDDGSLLFALKRSRPINEEWFSRQHTIMMFSNNRYKPLSFHALMKLVLWILNDAKKTRNRRKVNIGATKVVVKLEIRHMIISVLVGKVKCQAEV